MKKSIISLLTAVFVLLCLCSCQKKEPITNDNSSSGIHHVEMNIKDYGKIVLELDENQAPITTKNFIELSNSGFYNGLTLHRIMKDFMMQGGDPNGDGTGGSGKNIKGEFLSNGVQNNISHKRGVISMGRRSNDYDSASSQFFICHQDSTFLDGQYAAFGHVTEGMDVVDKICESAKPIDNNGTIPSNEQPVIESVNVID